MKQTTPQTATTMVPLIFVKDNFGADIVWDNKTKSAFIYTSKADSGGTSGGTNGAGAGGSGDNSSGGGMIGVVDEDPPATDGSTGGRQRHGRRRHGHD
ncbi:copper amine oxidase N-terminal domain-containing protein [Cohnella ginsengisoli]|uniref:Copper amine oxidase N-terminal domain-containing protein n=1 Tax=Cohnella ginsengisoli TaxID=425004 RepID=A0A9X4KCM6_9BACL|nr:stalk domain-containing protein [Cohnella ginsengisoli]MDG0789613.1 copper amine oxidase N-terminal domain-containing protein [Cohnella ginsengisoli]